jgi:hypothetical protein
MPWCFVASQFEPVVRTSIAAVLLLLASFAPCCAEPARAIHYAPAENLEHVDVALIRINGQIDLGLGFYHQSMRNKT